MTDQERPSNQHSGINPEYMPSLEPTAEVPAVHSDKLNDPQYWNDKFEGKTAKVPVEHRDVPKKPGIGKKLIASIAGVAVLGGGAFAGVKMISGGSDSHEPGVRPTATAPANPGETTKSPETTQDPASGPFEFGVTAAEFENDPEALAEEYYKQFNTFMIAGADKEAAGDDRRYEITDPEYVAEFSPEIDEAFLDNLFVSNWRENPELSEYIHIITDIAHSTRWSRIATYGGPEAGQDEPYEREMLLDKISGTTDPLTTSVLWHERDNRDMNNVENLIKGTDPNTQDGGETLTWVKIDGQLVISNITHFDG